MRQAIPNFHAANVVVFGDLMLDRYWRGDISRISPEAPVPVVNVSDTEDRIGGAGNVALNIQSLGCNVNLLAAVGKDEFANSLKNLLEKQAIKNNLIPVENSHTITKLRVVSQNQQLIRLDFENGFISTDFKALRQRFECEIEHADVVVLSDYDKGTLSCVEELIQACNKQNKKVLIDPKGSDYSKYRGASLLTPNESEFEAVVGKCECEEIFMQRGMKLCDDLCLDALLVTRSEKGMVLFRKKEAPFIQSTRAREVYDVTGAGDTVIATLASCLAAGMDFKESTQFANLAAGAVVGKLGTSTVSVLELQQAMLEHIPLSRGVKTSQELELLLQQAKNSGESIVMTNGCFDILHAGHVSYLSQAAELGDRLIVAVNSDESIKKLKGESRPINPLGQRMAVLSGLESVDWVVPFSEETPLKLIEALTPDVLVKGGDYDANTLVGSEEVREYGGQVKVLPFVNGCSTTEVIKKITNSKQR